MTFKAYIVFKTTTDAFECARILSSPQIRALNLFYEHCPAPKIYSSDCTLAIFLESKDENLDSEKLQKVRDTITQQLEIENIAFKLFEI